MKAPQQVGFINNISLGDIVEALNRLKADNRYATDPAYRGDPAKWPDHQISFIDFHLTYLRAHPGLNPDHYLANLKLILKKS